MGKYLVLDTLAMSLIITFCTIIGVSSLIALYFLILRNRKLARQVSEIDRRYEYLHTLLTASDFQHLKRIEMISQVNLLYSSILEKHQATYNYLKDEQDIYAQEKITQFNIAINSKKYSQVRKEITDFKRFMNDFEKDVTHLDNDLMQIIRPDEECSRMLIDAKDSLRLIKQEYELHQNEIIILKKSYEIVFKRIEELFDKFSHSVDQADYETATNLMPTIQKMLSALDRTNKEMPELCQLANQEVPQRITDLENELKHITESGYPVKYIVSAQAVAEMREEVRLIVRSLKEFSYKNARERLIRILNNIDSAFDSFNQEKEAKKSFDREFAPVYAHINKIEKEFIRLCNSLPKISKFYIISQEQIAKRNTIQGHINRIGVSKRSLDSSIHSNSPQPFSILLEKTIDLKSKSTEIEEEMSEFRDYLNSLKDDVEKSYHLVNEFYYRIRKAEKIIRDSALPYFKNKYNNKIEEIYKHLEIINTTSYIRPIDVEKINNSVSFITYQGESLINQIEQDYNMLHLAESAITYANQNRQKYSQVNSLLSQSEKMFFDGEFEKSYNVSTELIKRCSQVEDR